MFSNKTMREMINNLKGRISKMLTISRNLSEDELISLQGVCQTIDDIILWDKTLTKNKAGRFKSTLRGYSSLMKSTNKPYIKKHIIPVIDKVVSQEWVQ